MHITIRFFGDLCESLAGEVGERMLNVFNGRQRFSFDLHGLGTFTDRKKRPTVLWTGVYPEGHFVEIRRILDGALEGLPLPATNRHFRPHITLARMKKISPPSDFLETVVGHQEEEFGTSVVERIVLFRSVLKPAGPDYLSLNEVVFKE